MYVISNNFVKCHEFEGEKEEVYEKLWREEKEGRNDVNIL